MSPLRGRHEVLVWMGVCASPAVCPGPVAVGSSALTCSGAAKCVRSAASAVREALTSLRPGRQGVAVPTRAPCLAGQCPPDLCLRWCFFPAADSLLSEGLDFIPALSLPIFSIPVTADPCTGDILAGGDTWVSCFTHDVASRASSLRARSPSLLECTFLEGVRSAQWTNEPRGLTPGTAAQTSEAPGLCLCPWYHRALGTQPFPTWTLLGAPFLMRSGSLAMNFLHPAHADSVLAPPSGQVSVWTQRAHLGSSQDPSLDARPWFRFP